MSQAFGQKSTKLNVSDFHFQSRRHHPAQHLYIGDLFTINSVDIVGLWTILEFRENDHSKEVFVMATDGLRHEYFFPTAEILYVHGSI